MTQLLISVKNLAETALVLEAGVDIVDLKDPSVGALGALDLELTAQIVKLVDKKANTSATVGEFHQSLMALIEAIQARADLGVDIIKVAVGPLFHDSEFVHQMRELTRSGVQLVAVFFADEPFNHGLMEQLQSAGFYGAMLDTQNKHKNLLQSCNLDDLQLFTKVCQQRELKSGLAGSLRIAHIQKLAEVSPNYIGFRGGACEGDLRNQHLSQQKIDEIKSMLFECNKLEADRPALVQTALHSQTSLSIVRL